MRGGTITGVSTLVRLRGVAGSPFDDDGRRERVELLGDGADYTAAFEDVARQVPPGWLLLLIDPEAGD